MCKIKMFCNVTCISCGNPSLIIITSRMHLYAYLGCVLINRGINLGNESLGKLVHQQS